MPTTTLTTTTTKKVTAAATKANAAAIKRAGAAAAAAAPYSGAFTLCVSPENGKATIQPAQAEGKAVDTITVDLRKGGVTYGPAPALDGATAQQVLGIIGVLRLPSGRAALAAVKRWAHAGFLGGEGDPQQHQHDIHLVTEAVVITDEAGPLPSAEDARMLTLFRDGLDPEGAGRGLYCAPGAHLTLNAQKRAALPQSPAAPMPARAADRRFFWNRALAQPLLDAGADAYVSTMIMGSVRAFENARVQALDGTPAAVDVTLIARRGVDRVGTRYWHRGADPDTAAVANFVESEQVVTVRRQPAKKAAAASSDTFVASLVQVRGSMPMVWTQTPDGAFKPPTVLLDGKGTQRVFDEHATLLLEKYVGSPEANVTLVNLVKQTGSEGALAAQYGAEAARYDAGANNGGKEKNSVPPLHYIPFDFHKEAEGDYDAGLAKLWQLLAADFDRQGMWTRPAAAFAAANGKGSSGSSGVQVGVMRTNCIDCLDRTNVGQSLVGRKALARALAAAGVMSQDQAADPGAGPLMPTEAFEQAFRNLWADHGDDISRQYAGTAALKSEFTRTGKRTPMGYVEDALKSTKRYFVNNFFDGRKQDALDLASGAYVAGKKKSGSKAAASSSSSSSSTSPVVGMIIVAAVVVMAMAAAAAARAGGGDLSLPLLSSSSSSSSPLGDPSFVWYLLGALLLLLFLYVFVAPKLVTPPTLCPQLADTVNVCVKRGDGVARDLSHDGKAEAAATTAATGARRGSGKKTKAE